ELDEIDRQNIRFQTIGRTGALASNVRKEIEKATERTAKNTGMILAVALNYGDRKSTRLNSSHLVISYAVFCLKKKKRNNRKRILPNEQQAAFPASCLAPSVHVPYRTPIADPILSLWCRHRLFAQTYTKAASTT